MLQSISVMAVFIILLAGVQGPAAAKPKAVSHGFLTKSVKVGDKSFEYAVFVPESYDPRKQTPAIVALNGAGECGTDGLKQLYVGLGAAIMVDVAKWQQFVILFPQKQMVEHNWEDEDDMVMAQLNQTLREFNIDKSRIYLTGLSQGGHGSFAIGAKHPDIFAAIAPVCGWGDKSLVSGLTKNPIWIFHGGADEVVNVERSKEMAEWLKAAGADCKLTLYPGVGHGSWDKAYRDEDLPSWFLQHHK